MILELAVQTRQRECLVDVTHQLARSLQDAGVHEGILTAFVPHTTAGITINENADPDVCTDMLGYLAKLIPARSDFRHAEGNSDAHIKASLIGSSVQVIIQNGRMRLGTWQGVYVAEFDGPRSRKLLVHIGGN